MVANANSHKAKDIKCDEFRTQLAYIQKGLFTILMIFLMIGGVMNEAFWLYNR